MQRNDVKFIRRNGRIIPIRINKATKARIKEGGIGAALVTAGAAVSASSGRLHKAVLRMSTGMSARAMRSLERTGARQISPGQLSFFNFQKADKAANLALKLSNKATKIASFATPLRKGGLFAGALLLGVGASRIARATSGEENPTLETTVGAAASALAFKSKGASQFLFKAGGYPRAALGEVAKRTYPHLRKLKSSWYK